MTPEEIEEDYEKNTGKVIIETFRTRGIDPVHVPGVLCASHGPFTWGKDAAQAVYHAVVLEEVAKMALLTLPDQPQRGACPPACAGPSTLCASTAPTPITARKSKAGPELDGPAEVAVLAFYRDCYG